MIRTPRRDGATILRAKAAVLTGKQDAAVAALAPLLGPHDPDSAPADRFLVDTALLWAAQRIRDHDAPHAAVQWCRYAHTTATTLHGWQHPTALRAARLLAQVHTARGEHLEAYDAYSAVVAALCRTDLDGACRAGAQADLAAHAAGRCSEAVAHLTAVWDSWQLDHDPTDRTGLFLLYRLTAMLAACGRREEARRRFRDAEPALPPPGTPARLGERRHAAAVLDDASRAHDLVCPHQRGARYRRRSAPAAAVLPIDRAMLLP
ncbi:hypothetical protein ABZS66_28210 [Dactylosporangium sp. NPDC005572]|uniref:hypothetical protein n=1 Tax=Dactylosporangium sp. NPDC005572 TaxID=3156889 RepID=UPI0033AC12AC